MGGRNSHREAKVSLPPKTSPAAFRGISETLRPSRGHVGTLRRL